MTFLDTQRFLQRFFQRTLAIIADVLQDFTAVMHLNRQSSMDFFKKAQVSGTIALTVPP